MSSVVEYVYGFTSLYFILFYFILFCTLFCLLSQNKPGWQDVPLVVLGHIIFPMFIYFSCLNGMPLTVSKTGKLNSQLYNDDNDEYNLSLSAELNAQKGRLIRIILSY